MAFVYDLKGGCAMVHTMVHVRCSRFLTALAQFHSNRSRLIHGVQFNPDLPPPPSTPSSSYYTYFKLSISVGRAPRPFRISRRVGSGRISTEGLTTSKDKEDRTLDNLEISFVPLLVTFVNNIDIRGDRD